jgi:pyruvate dehydrogenase E1 component
MALPAGSARTANRAARDIEHSILKTIEKRVLWLSIQMVHYANSVRENEDGIKVGGHPASSASLVSLMTALWFRHLRPTDRVSVKPHASPVYHAIQYLLGNFPQEKLRQFRSYGGIQAYPSRTKDCDGVDFSTGSVGLGAVMPTFSALARRFVEDHFGNQPERRFISIVGDAELDEGNVWEAVAEDNLKGLGGVLWIVDLNRQSLDRVVPSGKVATLKDMFRSNGWHVLELKYGNRLQAAFSQPDGERLRQRIDDMPNDEYQSLLRVSDGDVIRRHVTRPGGRLDVLLEKLLANVPAAEMRDLLGDLGGHDMYRILDCLELADQVKDRPVVLFAYTVKGWGLPIAGDPMNHSRLLTGEQMVKLRQDLGIDADEEFAAFDPASSAGKWIVDRARYLGQPLAPVAAPSLTAAQIPTALESGYKGRISTQQAFGSVMTALSRQPGLAERIVTFAPDVASSTNLGGWLNKMGVYSHEARPDYFRQNAIPMAMRWEQSPKGQHIELGISENNLFLALAAFGLSEELLGETLLPVGTIYDTFIGRGLDALNYAAYCDAKFIFIGTPSGISLSPEGGAHQSIYTPSIGIELPNITYYEPCFAQELEWILLEALRNILDRKGGRSSYLRLSTVPVSQDLFDPAAVGRRADVLAGGYRLIDQALTAGYAPAENVVNLAASGVTVPLAVEASRRLAQEGVLANVINVTSPSLLYRSWVEARSRRGKNPSKPVSFHLERLIPEAERATPIVTVMDGHSHALSFLGSVFGAKAAALGVNEFGQSGTLGKLYEHYEINVDAMIRAVESLM